MYIRSILTVAALVTMFSAFAQNTPATSSTHTFSFPPVSLQTGQTAEIDVTNVAANSSATAASCTVTISILGATNNTLVTSGATPITVTTGQISSVKIAGTGTPVRGVVVITPSTASPRPPCSLEFSFQTYDTSGAGATHVFLTGRDQAPVIGFGRN